MYPSTTGVDGFSLLDITLPAPVSQDYLTFTSSATTRLPMTHHFTLTLDAHPSLVVPVTISSHVCPDPRDKNTVDSIDSIDSTDSTNSTNSTNSTALFLWQEVESNEVVYSLRNDHARRWGAFWTEDPFLEVKARPAGDSDVSNENGGDNDNDNDSLNLNSNKEKENKKNKKKSKNSNKNKRKRHGRAISDIDMSTPGGIKGEPLTYKIIVLAYNRPNSLERLLQSLLLAEYVNM